ncbi:MAG: DnaJ domain-containing protein [Tatlockia sp.]|nr:DnaJ domain-containing protein [Tatlockia sp.]
MLDKFFSDSTSVVEYKPPKPLYGPYSKTNGSFYTFKMSEAPEFIRNLFKQEFQDIDFNNMDRKTKTNFYEILEVNIDADEETIKKAFRKKALQSHPDKKQSNESTDFINLHEAYETLGDSKRREIYDSIHTSSNSNEKHLPFDDSIPIEATTKKLTELFNLFFQKRGLSINFSSHAITQEPIDNKKNEYSARHNLKLEINHFFNSHRTNIIYKEIEQFAKSINAFTINTGRNFWDDDSKKGESNVEIHVYSVEMLQKAINSLKTELLEIKTLNPQLNLAAEQLYLSTQRALKDNLITQGIANRINYLTNKILISPNLEDIQDLYLIKRIHFEWKATAWKKIAGCILVFIAVALLIGALAINPFAGLSVFLILSGALFLAGGVALFNKGREKEIRTDLNSFFKTATNFLDESTQCELEDEEKNPSEGITHIGW